MTAFVRFLKDPLAHFLIAGAILFAILSALAPPEEEESRRIEVTRAALLGFIQYRSKAFDEATAAAMFDGMDAEAKKRLIDEFVEEEALYREADSFGLAAGDYVIRQRMVQKVSFIADAAAGAEPPSEDEIAAFFEANRARFREPPTATFAHAFFAERRRDEMGDARAAVRRLNASKASAEAATAEGDRFPFHTNYVERTFDYAASQFGEDTARAIFDPKGPFGVWRGPYRSPYGAHAVFVVSAREARDLTLDEIRDAVAEAAARDKAARARQDVIAETIARYEVSIEEGLFGAP